MIYRVDITKAKKDIKKVPLHIRTLLFGWIDDVEERGLEEVRKVLGYHDEPLQGKRLGQRSIRLSRSYRAIYVIKNDGVEFASVEEVHKHDY
jgi:proteic killer suppression protein